MTRKLIALVLAAAIAALLIPAAVLADGAWVMYVYTDNGKSLNVRSDPMTGDNIIGTLPFGREVTVRMTTSNGWACINYPNAQGGVAYVMSRYLVPAKPASKSGPPTTAPQSPAKPTTAPVSPGSPVVPVSPSSPAANTTAAQTLNDMNAQFRSARAAAYPYTVVARPVRASGWVNLRWAPSLEAERIATCPQGKELTVLCELKDWYQVQDPQTGMIGFISRQYVTVK